jgi:putative restriction endonuclease
VTPEQVVQFFGSVRRAQNDGRYAPHKPLLLLLALARVQQGEPRLATLAQIEPKLKILLAEFGPTNAERTAHFPFWHLKSDANGALWQVQGSEALLNRPAGSTPTLGELRQEGVQAGFAPEVQNALDSTPGMLERAAQAVLRAYFPESLHEDILGEIGLSLDGAGATHGSSDGERRRDPAFREKVLRAYEYRCCVCGFSLQVGHRPAGLEAAHIQWHTAGGPDLESNGLSLCSLHHKLFDLGAFKVQPHDRRIVFSQQAITSERGLTGVLAHHGKLLLPPQSLAMSPAAHFLEWNVKNVFKGPGRELV